MTELFTDAQRARLVYLRDQQASPKSKEAIDAALREIDRLTKRLALALSALPDSETAGPNGTGFKYAWNELNDDEQEWVKQVRQEATR